MLDKQLQEQNEKVASKDDFPINWIDKKIKNSFGIIFDDIIAGIYSVICLMIINAVI